MRSDTDNSHQRSRDYADGARRLLADHPDWVKPGDYTDIERAEAHAELGGR